MQPSAMKFTAATVALFAGLAAAWPAASTARTTEHVTLKFWAAAQTSTFDVSVPIDGTSVIDSNLSFTSISSVGPSNANFKCEAYGVDGSNTVLYGSASDVPIGPPQEQTFAICYYI